MNWRRRDRGLADIRVTTREGATAHIEVKGGGALTEKMVEALMMSGDNYVVIFRGAEDATSPSVIPSAEGHVSFRGFADADLGQIVKMGDSGSEQPVPD